jgi:hypothetical protein
MTLPPGSISLVPLLSVPSTFSLQRDLDVCVCSHRKVAKTAFGWIIFRDWVSGSRYMWYAPSADIPRGRGIVYSAFPGGMQNSGRQWIANHPT